MRCRPCVLDDFLKLGFLRRFVDLIEDERHCFLTRRRRVKERGVIRQQKGVINERQSNRRALMFQFETRLMLFTTECRAWERDGERKRNFSLRDKISYLTNKTSSSSTQTDFIRDHRQLLRYPFSAIQFVLLTLRCGSVFGGFGQSRLSPALFST